MTHPLLLAAMSRPEFYPTKPDRVDVLQTHISYLFLAGDLVYKVKKDVDFGFLDFTTLERRRYYCLEELRLNRRLAPSIYLDVTRITEAPDGDLVLEGPGPVVDYAVVMKRLPEERMLKRLLAFGKADLRDMERISAKVAAFHASAETGGEIDAVGGPETVRRNHEENFEQTRACVGVTIPEYQYTFIRASALRFLEANRDVFLRRVANHRVRDCHGDMHIEHICLLDGEIIIFDCIEFNERFRYADVAAEVAFLAMDLDFNGYPRHAEAFVNAYVEHSGDNEVPLFLNFYKSYYAYVRGKVTGFRTRDGAVSEADRDAARAPTARYFDLAYTYASRLDRPTLILTCGLMGTGKSLLAEGLASRLGAARLQMDALRKELLSIPATEHRFDAFRRGIYSEDVTRHTYAEALSRAETSLREGVSVVIDASFMRRDERLRAKSLAERLHAGFLVAECRCPEEVLRRRLDARLVEQEQVSDGRWEIYKAQKADFEPVTELMPDEHIVVNTEMPPEACVDAVVRRLKGIE